MAGASDNGGWSSDGGSPDDLPDLPEEWGVIVIPDDLSELSDEVEAIRAELKLAERPSGWRRLIHRPGVRRLRRMASATLRAPVLIISMAILVTVASLVASAWPGPPGQPAAQRTADSTDDGDMLPALDLIGADGQTVPLRGKLPAVILLTDGCDCTKLIADTITAVRPEIAVIVVAAASASVSPSSAAGAVTPPTGATPQAQGKTVQVLRDPAGNIRTQLKVGARDGTAAVFLVDRTGQIIRRDPRTASVEDIRPDLARL
jgi:hypothetical protein